MRSSAPLYLALLAALLVAAACVPIAPEETAVEPQQPGLRVVAFGVPLANYVYNIAGNLVDVDTLVPAGVDPHMYEPTPSDAVKLAEADMVIMYGASNPEMLRASIQAIVGDETSVILTAPLALEPEDYIYDEFGVADPHFGGDIILARKQAAVIRDVLSEHDPANADAYHANYAKFAARVDELDVVMQAVADSIPEENRRLYVYHNSVAYIARRYGYTIVGVLQPHDFSEPSAKDVAEAIEMLRELNLPAIFGSSFTPSSILEQISSETGIPVYWYDDMALPGEPGDPEHSLFYKKVHNQREIAEALGGDPSLLDGIETRNVPDTE